MKLAVLTLLALTACGETDNDGDGVSMQLDCDDNNSEIGEMTTFYVDADGDGFGDELEPAESCYAPDGFVDNATDCDDTNISVYPGAVEVCNGVDDNCNMDIDDQASVGTWYADADGDGYGDPNAAYELCEPSAGLVSNDEDCDDLNADIRPGVDETCDEIDNDCDDTIDELATDAITWYRDDDNDGYGSDISLSSCDQPTGYTDQMGDCDDDDDSSYPSAPEMCDLIDNDCDKLIDNNATDATTWYADLDEDNYGDATSSITACDSPSGYNLDNSDCDDSNAAIHPETWWYLDNDADLYGSATGPVQACIAPANTTFSANDCDDNNAAINPGADEICDNLDNDCDGDIDSDDAIDAIVWYADGDGDGYGTDVAYLLSCLSPGEDFSALSGDCDDTNPSVSPSELEVCDDTDNDCDGLVDDADDSLSGIPIWYQDADNDGYGNWEVQVQSCDDVPNFVIDGTDCNDMNELVHYGATELCDGLDNDCDSLIDGADALDSSTWYFDGDGDTYGDPGVVVQTCEEPSGYVVDGTDCDDASAAVHPFAEEDCDDTQDYNCDGSFGLVDADGDTYNACEECDDSNALIYPGGVEECDGIDNDCNGLIDDDGMGNYPWQWYLDEDGDGYGLSYEGITWCDVTDPVGYAILGDDCDDSDATRHPYALEICNMQDDDCDGIVPADEVDLDGDGFTPLSCGGGDCDDFASDVNPDMFEVCDDGLDNDCVDGDDGCLYEFSGVQTNVNIALLDGWEECFSETFSTYGTAISSILGMCDKAKLMVACRQTGSAIFTTLAYADRTDVLFDTGTGNTLHYANDVGWYYSASYSMGYVNASDNVARNSCDTDTGSFPQHRLCIHTGSNQWDGGYRCGSTTGLNSSGAWQRVILHAD
jgi:hypothetical protein